MLENTELIFGILALSLAVLGYFGYYKTGSAKEIDKDNKILNACEAVHEILGPYALATPNKIDDMVDVLLFTVIKLLRDKHKIEELSESEKEAIKKFFVEKLKK